MPLKTLGFGSWLHTKVVDPLLQIIRRGAEPKQLAFSSALGFTLGVFPICGVTVFLCGLAITILGSHCHAPTVLLTNFVATPVELSLIVPFLRLGETISGGSHFALTSDALKKVLTGEASTEVLLSIFHALLGWLIATPFIMAVLYILLLPCFKVLVRKFKSSSSSPKKPSSEVRLKHHLKEEHQDQKARAPNMADSSEMAELLVPLRSSQSLGN
ncbi:uncharacterized protein LOC141605352 isoform X1 [Silene latifolia]|uniref:uncharacterized protein LOC141605352 isoform X1 n=1 Tax=Silene latifolia TaxID=37657 RepID=UPI003D77AEE8